MLKEKRKTTQAPVSKMKKGQLMKELITNSNLLTIDAKHEDAPDVYSKKTANQILEKSQVDKQYVPLEGYKYGAEEIDRPGAKQFARMTGKTREAQKGFIGKTTEEMSYSAKGHVLSTERKKASYHTDLISGETIQQPVGKDLGKKSMKQTDQPVSASQKVAPATKRQSAKKTALAEADEPVGASARAISEAMTVKSVRGRPPKNMGMGVGSDKEVPSALAPPHLVLSQSQSYEQQQLKPNLTRLEKPMKYGGGYVEPKGQVAKAVAKVEEKQKRVLSEEHKAKMKAGRERAKKEKENK